MLGTVACKTIPPGMLSTRPLREAVRAKGFSQGRTWKRTVPLDDFQLVEKLKEGAEDAFHELFERYKDRIFNVVFRIIGDSAECEDVVQEVFLKVIRNIGSFNHKSALYTWLYRIAVNAAVDFKKKFKPHGVISIYRQDGVAKEIPSPSEYPEVEPQRREMAKILDQALNQLSEKHRTILILREFQGLSYSEISEVLGCSKGTVESRLFRARGRLREKMERYL